MKCIVNLKIMLIESQKSTSEHIIVCFYSKYAEAIQYYDKALSISPINIEIFNDKANSLSKLGNYTGAIQYYDKALAINPNDKFALNNKVLAQENLNKK